MLQSDELENESFGFGDTSPGFRTLHPGYWLLAFFLHSDITQNEMNNEPLQSLVGNRIEKAKYDEGSDSWLLRFRDGSSLNIECMWRLLEDGVITSTSFDHGQMFGRKKPFNGEAALNEMAAHEILSVSPCVETGDVTIKLGKYFELQIIPISAGYESWQFKENNGKSIVAVSGQFHV